jgi:biotin carboxylase
MKSLDNSYFWIIGGGEMQVPAIAEARALGLRVICSDMNAECVCAPLADIFLSIDIFDIDGHLKSAGELRQQGIQIAGVLAAGIDAPETMARVARALGLPGVDPEIAQLVHNKAAFRAKLSELGFPVPRFSKVTSAELEHVADIAGAIGYPLIVKNTDSSGSRGTQIFYQPDPEGVRAVAAEAIAVSRSGMALIESFWEGPEQTVETLFDVNGNFHPCFITDRHFDKSNGYALETGLQHPSVLPADTQSQMYQIAEDVARALGITIGAAKYDFILTPEGPRIIEMTVRLSGGFDCQYLVPAATGKNVLRAAILTALGLPFTTELLQDRLHKTGLSRSLWPQPGVIRAIRHVDRAREIPGVEKIVMRSQVGDRVQAYTDCTKRVCFIIVSGESHDAAEAVVAEVERTLEIDVEEA